MTVVFSLLLGLLLAGGLYAIATGAQPVPFVLAAAVPLVGLQIVRRRARGIAAFDVGADASRSHSGGAGGDQPSRR